MPKIIDEKARDEKIPLSTNFINLYFRKAFQENIDYIAGRSKLEENPFTYYKREFEKRFNRKMSSLENLYWDLLYEINVKGKAISHLLEEAERHDPEKEKFIRKMINDPHGEWRKEKIFHISK